VGIRFGCGLDSRIYGSVLWDVMLCSLVGVRKHFGGPSCLRIEDTLLLWRWRQWFPPNCRYPYTKLQSVMCDRISYCTM